MIDRDKLYLTHIAECIEHIEEYTAPGCDHFMASRLTQDAVIRNFEIIGEAARHLSESTFEQTPDIPWHRITAFRNVLIHGYFKVDLEQVWNVIENDLPNLKEAVKYLLQ
jgi:uncharacterized protein with HEPN domain